MPILDQLDNLLSEVVRPIGDTVLHAISHPIDTVSNVLTGTAHLAQAHPYASATFIGLGAYAFHRGWLKIENNKLQVNINIDTCVFAYRTNTSIRIGPR